MQLDKAVKEILEAEQSLKQAILGRDIATLDRLLSDDVIFTNHLGQLISKEQDLDTYRAGNLIVEDFDASDINVRVYGTTAVVTLLVKIRLKYKMQAIEGAYRYTRVYLNQQERWQIVAAHSTAIVN